MMISSPLLEKEFYLSEADSILAFEFNYWPLKVKAAVFNLGYKEVMQLKEEWEKVIFDGFLDRISKRYRCRYEGVMVSLPKTVEYMDLGLSWATIRRQAKERKLPAEIMAAINELIENDLVEGGQD